MTKLMLVLDSEYLSVSVPPSRDKHMGLKCKGKDSGGCKILETQGKVTVVKVQTLHIKCNTK